MCLILGVRTETSLWEKTACYLPQTFCEKGVKQMQDIAPDPGMAFTCEIILEFL